MRRWGAETAYLAAIIGIIAGLMVGMAAIAKADGCPDRVTFYAAGYPDAASTTAPPGTIPITSPGGIFPWESGGYDHGQQVGAANTVAMVDDMAARCPDTRITIRGHSYGAAIVHTAVATIDQRPYAGRVTAHLTGDPRRPGGIEDTYRGLSVAGITMRGAGITPTHLAGYTNDCHDNDLICSAPNIVWDPLGFGRNMVGYLVGAHRYP